MQTKSTSLTGLPQKKITTGLKRLQEAGLTPDRWLKMLNAQPDEMQRIVAAFPDAAKPVSMDTGIVYDAATVSRILGLTCECNDPVPEAADGEVVFYYGGWDLQTLRSSTAGKKRMWQEQDWYDDKGWKAEPGYYRVNLRVPDSNRKNWSEQLSHLKTFGEALQPASVTVAATALLAHLTETGNDLLKQGWCRCAESLPSNYRAALTVRYGRVYVVLYGWDNCRHDNVWLSNGQKI